jgi:transcriptional regulator with XRE-family HTH domain
MTTNKRETIGKRLRRLRKERGLSQSAICGPGTTTAHISRIEAGLRKPSVKALRLLAARIGVSAGYLETGEDLIEIKLERTMAERALYDLRLPRFREPIAEIIKQLSDQLEPEEDEPEEETASDQATG